MKARKEALQDSLEKLKNNCHLIAIKAEFEAEGTRIDELAILSKLCCDYMVPLTLKTGGPCAQRDLYEAFQLGASNILIPMVESSYAAEKCSEAFKRLCLVFEGIGNSPSLMFNIETKTSYTNIDKIISVIKEKDIPISCIVIGRTDLSNSLEVQDVNDTKVLELTQAIMEKANDNGIKVNLGGGMNSCSFNFIKELSQHKLNAYESRKCTFEYTSSLSEDDYKKTIKLGLQFELAWLMYKKDLYKVRSCQDDIRIKTLYERINV